LKGNGVNSRWVTSREPALSSVVVEQNKLISQGIEICLIPNGNNLLIGQTEAVQPFKELSFRDYGRPARDDLSGMLPPKLAQIMINLAVAVETRRSASLLDPFCGSGTILTEALLMGFTNLIGADISTKAIEYTKKNINWIIDKYAIHDTRYAIHNLSTLKLPSIIKENSIDAIVTEPYLGPQRGKFDYFAVKKELEKLYSDSLIIFKKTLKPDGRVVMVWPVFRFRDLKQTISPRLNGFKIISPLPNNFITQPDIHLTDRQTIIYGRPEQKIWREIVILTLD
jgi:tRNA G10  N-methylase Trm11